MLITCMGILKMLGRGFISNPERMIWNGNRIMEMKKSLGGLGRSYIKVDTLIETQNIKNLFEKYWWP